MTDKQSKVFADLINKIPEGKLKLGHFFKLVGEGGTALLLFILALPNALAFPVPGFSTLTGVPMLYFAYRLMSGKEYSKLPKYFADKELSKEVYAKILNFCIKALNVVEKFAKPRKSDKFTDSYDKFAGGVAFIMAAIMCLPIPLGNALPGAAIVILALAVLEKDLFFFYIGVITSIISTFWVAALVYAFFRGAELSLGFISHLFN